MNSLLKMIGGDCEEIINNYVLEMEHVEIIEEHKKGYNKVMKDLDNFDWDILDYKKHDRICWFCKSIIRTVDWDNNENNLTVEELIEDYLNELLGNKDMVGGIFRMDKTNIVDWIEGFLIER